ncbi:hypothetical protein [Actinorugispora endophytica]|uniref:hypothetical protein n=1 Tax=Actinorugispora endophytica TaxID=1605990 RepID=UPI001FB7E6F4|nr:hypothetical protein [Actinorugispora endophytica]
MAELSRQVRHAWFTWQNREDRYTRLAGTIIDLVTDIRRRSESMAAGEDAHKVACEGYFLLRTFARRIGRSDLALIAADRGKAAADRLSSPVYTAGAQWNIAHALLAQDEPEAAEDVALAAVDAAERHPEGSKELTALSGALWLTAAVAAARSNRGRMARKRVHGQAVAASGRTGEGNVLWTAFGPANVALHAMYVELEDGATADALRIAAGVDPAPLPSRERHTTFFLDVARCYHQSQDEDAAVVHLLKAERTSPEDLRYDPVAHDVVRGVLKHARRSLAPQVHRLAERIGLTG